MNFEGQCTLTVFYIVPFSWAIFDRRFINYTSDQHTCLVVLNIVIQLISNFLSSDNDEISMISMLEEGNVLSFSMYFSLYTKLYHVHSQNIQCLNINFLILQHEFPI